MELPVDPAVDADHSLVHRDVPTSVVIAFDQLTDGEKAGVLEALYMLEREGLQRAAVVLGIRRLAGTEPLYSLRAAPEVRVIVRADDEEPIQIVDIARPAALRNFAHAG